MDERAMVQSERTSDALRDEALAAVRSTLRAEKHPDFDGNHCVKCGEPIALKRLDMGKVYCTPCQHTIELLRRTTGAWKESNAYS